MTPDSGPGQPDTLLTLVTGAKAGDTECFSGIVELTSGRIYALCLRLCGNEFDARDAMQETYFRAFRSLAGFRQDSSLQTWLYRIATNCCLSQLAQRNIRSAHSVALDNEVMANMPDHHRESDPEFTVEFADDRLRLIAALAGLPFALRSVVVLGDVYDLPHEEIARELGISRAAVKVRLHRGRRKLHDVLFSAVLHQVPQDGDENTHRPEAKVLTLRTLRPHRDVALEVAPLSGQGPEVQGASGL